MPPLGPFPCTLHHTQALSDAHAFLFEERQRLLASQAENDDLRLQEIEDRKRIQQLLNYDASVRGGGPGAQLNRPGLDTLMLKIESLQAQLNEQVCVNPFCLKVCCCRLFRALPRQLCSRLLRFCCMHEHCMHAWVAWIQTALRMQHDACMLSWISPYLIFIAASQYGRILRMIGVPILKTRGHAYRYPNAPRYPQHVVGYPSTEQLAGGRACAYSVTRQPHHSQELADYDPGAPTDGTVLPCYSNF
jgi:hypothetical protein